ncbi:MAG: 5-deoxy-glucuronate isomerase [Arenicella sp.]
MDAQKLARRRSYDELVAGGDCALVSKGYHSSVSCSGSNMFFLNYLAGDLLEEKRNAPLCSDQQHTWIHDDWENGICL